MINTNFTKTQKEVIEMTENNCLIEKITHTEEDIQKKLKYLSYALIIANFSAVSGMIVLITDIQYASDIAFIVVGVCSVIVSCVTIKLMDIFDNMKHMNSKIIVKLLNEDKQKEVN